MRIKRSLNLRFTSDGKHLIALGSNLTFWNIHSGEKLLQIKPLSYPSSLDISPSTTELVVKNTGGRIAVLSLPDFATICSPPIRKRDEGCQILYSPCGRLLIDGSWSGALMIRDAKSGEIVSQERQENTMIKWLSCTRVRDLYAYIRQPKVPDRVSSLPPSQLILRKWPFDAHPEIRLSVSAPYVKAIQLSPNGQSIAVLLMGDKYPECQLEILALPDGRIMSSHTVQLGGTNLSLAWSPDGLLLGCVEEGQISIFDTVSLHRIARHVDPYPCYVEFSPDGSLIALGSWEWGTVKSLDQLEQL
jgi:WD40 repeat protein